MKDQRWKNIVVEGRGGEGVRCCVRNGEVWKDIYRGDGYIGYKYTKCK